MINFCKKKLLSCIKISKNIYIYIYMMFDWGAVVAIIY